MNVKHLFNRIRDHFFPGQRDLIAQEIDQVEDTINKMEARAAEHEALAQQLRAGVRRLRRGDGGEVFKLPHKVAA